MEKIDFENIYFNNTEEVCINKYYKFIRRDNHVTLLYNDFEERVVENTITIFISAMKLTFHEVHIYPISDNEGGLVNSMRNGIIDYYTNENNHKHIVEYSRIEFTEEKIQLLKCIFNILCRRSQKNYKDEIEGNEQYKFESWQVAYNYYLNACFSISIDGGIVYLVSGLEALLTNKEEGLSKKTSLRAAIVLDDKEGERKDTFEFIKQMYDIRSLVVHGDPEKLLKGKYQWFFQDSYSAYFKLKKILSNILVKLDKMTDKRVLIEQIQKNIFDAQLKCEPIVIS